MTSSVPLPLPIFPFYLYIIPFCTYLSPSSFHRSLPNVCLPSQGSYRFQDYRLRYPAVEVSAAGLRWRAGHIGQTPRLETCLFRLMALTLSIDPGEVGGGTVMQRLRFICRCRVFPHFTGSNSGTIGMGFTLPRTLPLPSFAS